MKQVILTALFALPSLLLAQPSLTFTPNDGAVGVSTTNDLKIESDDALRMPDNSAITNSSVDDLIILVDDQGNEFTDINADISGSKKTITIHINTPLAELTTYTLTLLPVENSDDEPITQSITFTTGDFTDPVINFARGVDNIGTGFTFEVNVSEDATVYYVVDDENSTPSRTEIEAGKSNDGSPADASGSFTVTGGITGSDVISGLSFTPATKYYIYYFAEDAAGNRMDFPEKHDLPLLISSSTLNATPSQFDLRVKVDETGTAYYVVTQSSTAPTAAQIIAGQDENGATPVASGSFGVTANNNATRQITGLDDGTTYYVHFLAVDGSDNQTVVATETATTTDGTPPSVTALSPADGTVNLDISTNTFTITFDENVVTSSSPASMGSDRIRLYENGISTPIESITRSNAAINISGSTVTITFASPLEARKDYYITIGDDVFSDPAGNDFPGYTNSTDWNFSTSGITVNNAASSICAGSFQSIGNIVISETGVADFNTGSSKTLTLSLADASEFVFSKPGVSVSGTSADITALSVSVGLTSLTVTYTVAGGTVLDNITISGLAVYTTGDAASTTIIRTGGDADIDGGNGTGGSSLTYATITVGSSAPAQTQLAPSQDLIYCDGEDISGATLSVVDQGSVTYNWYSDASLTTLVKSTSGTSVNLVSDLGLTSPAVAGTYSYYVVTVGSCQSAPPLEVDIEVGVNPVADAGPEQFVCPRTRVTLGGNPTLQTPSAPGAYTYTWDYLGGTPEPNSEANPTYDVDNASTTTEALYEFQVTVTDANGCSGTDTQIFHVKPTFNVALTSPNSYVFSPNSPNQTLTATPGGGVFTGVGVIQSGLGSYQFSPQAAMASNTDPLPKSFDVFYTVSSSNCTRENVPIAAFTLSNSFFGNLEPQYCASEYPNPSATSGVKLSIDEDGYTAVITRQNNWNSIDRFSRVPFTGWAALVTYPYNTFVQYNGELYRCNNPSGCGGLLATPPDADANWKVSLRVAFHGLIANLYETAYGGNPAPTVVKSGETYTLSGGQTFNYYRFGTNENYFGCPSCNFAYPGVYLEFEQTEDVRYFIPSWISGGFYSTGATVKYNDEIFKRNTAASNGTAPPTDPGWTNVTNGEFGTGTYIQIRDPDTNQLRSGMFVIGQYVQINRNPTVFFSGLTDGEDVCEFDVLDLDNPSVSGTNLYQLTGNLSNNQSLNQEFLVRLDGEPAFGAGGGAIVNDPVKQGVATFDTKKAFGTGGGTVKNVQIQYKVDPGTKGSTAEPCYGTSVITVQIVENKSFDFDDNVVNPNGTVYCYTEAAKNLRAINEASVVISGTTGQANSVSYSGFGVTDLGNSLGTLKPDLAIEQISPGTTTQQAVPVIAIYRDANLCQSKRTRTFKVNPDLHPSFTSNGRTNYCYEDATNTFTGHTDNFSYNSIPVSSSGKYDFIYRDPLGVDHTLQSASSSNTGFNAKEMYDDVQAILNSSFPTYANQSVNINVVYTETLNAGKVCSETSTQTMAINTPISLDIFGLTDGDILCRNDNTDVTQGHLVTFDGSVSGSGTFHLDDDNDFSSINPTLDGTVNTTSGRATINLLSAYNAASDPNDQREVYLQYQYTGPGCTGPADVIKKFTISPPPDLTFDFGTSPADAKVFCYDDAPVQLATNENVNVTLAGYGITDSGTGNGTATFNPSLAYTTSVSNGGTLNTPQDILVTARIVDGIGCANVNTVTYTVNPIPQASLNTGSLDYCYEDVPRTLQGQQANSWFQIVYQGVTTPHTDNSLGSLGAPMPSITFDPKARFNDAVNNYGASALTPVKFDVYYTVADNNSCTNTIGPYTLTVANQIEVKIAGMDDDDIFCSNETNGVKALSFNPFPADPSKRIFRINGQTVPLSTDKYSFNPGLGGGDFDLRYVVISGNNCTNTDTLRVKVLPSPRAVFGVEPRCEGDLIDFNADDSDNLPSAIYTWTLSDSVRSGQNIQHRFPGVSTYSVQLHVAYPAYNNDPSLVCQDSLRLDQIVGPVPNMHFTFFNVCESDTTSFVANPDIPISAVAWDFGDGESTSFGFQADNIPPTSTTSGKYGAPVHLYATAGNYNVVVSGKTAPVFGGCVDQDTVEIAILKNWSPTPAAPAYDMSTLDGGKGFWVKEDVAGNSTWEFGVPSKQHINTTEKAWVTGATQPYKSSDISYVNSPCFDLSSFSRPVLSIKHWTDTENSDGAVMQYSVDGGEHWQRLGNVASGLEWYNRLTILANPGGQQDLSSGWSLTNQNQWVVGKHTLDMLPLPRKQVRFRIAFASSPRNSPNPQSMDGFAFNDVVIEERNRTILVENFTNLSAVNNNTAFRDFHATNGVFNTAELVKLQYHHASGTAPDELNLANPVDQNARAAFYGVTSPTRAFIDGGFGQASTNATFLAGDLLNTYFSLRSLVTAPVDIAIDFPAEPGDKLNVKATVKATSDLGAPGQYNVFIAVAEQEVDGQVYVLRKFLPDASGTPLTALSPADPAQEIVVSYDMRHVTKLENGDYAPFAVIVFVQNLETKEVLQTAIRQDATPSSNIVTGVETAYDQSIRLYPNPADGTINIILPAPVKSETPVRIFDTFGRQVYDGAFAPGEHIKEVETKAFSAGVYLIQLSTPRGVIRKKAMIIHD